MDTRIDEVADRIFRLSTFVSDIGPTGFTFNQYLIDDHEPLLFQTGHRGMFPLVSEAIASGRRTGGREQEVGRGSSTPAGGEAQSGVDVLSRRCQTGYPRASK